MVFHALDSLDCCIGPQSGNRDFLHFYDLSMHIHATSIFYVNDSDGNTVIYNQKWNPEQGINQELTVMEEIEPVGNRLICFDGLHIHTGHNPMKHSNRILINTNFA